MKADRHENLYKRLARHLDNLPGGFPSTKDGVEIRLLRRLFSPEEAQWALKLNLIAEEPDIIARRVGSSVEKARNMLESMSKKGLILKRTFRDRPARYMAAQYVVGIWEFHVNDLDRDLIEDMETYIPDLMKEAWKRPQLRTIPVERGIDPDLKVMTYERAEQLISKHDRFALMPCICRRERTMMGKGCQAPEYSCLSMGKGAKLVLERGYGLKVFRKEVTEFLKRADDHALVLQPANYREANFMCFCCGCCCGVLRNVKKMPVARQHVSSSFTARFDIESCAMCGICVARCQMEAVWMTDDGLVFNSQRCIGCGLCVSTCPTGAAKLKRIPENRIPKLPRDMVGAALAHARARGKLGLLEMGGLMLRSRFDRFLARLL